MTLAASYALPTPDAIVPEMDDFFGNDAKALPFHAGDSPTPDDVVPEMTMMEHSQMPVTDKMEEAGMGQGHGSGEESENDGEGGEDMEALLPYIQKCQAKLPAGDMCKTLDPMMCAHSDPPPASCDECKSRLMGCVKDAAGTGAGQGSGEGSEHDVVPEMTMMEHPQMPVTDKMEEAGMGQGHGSGEEPENDGHEHHHHCQGGEQADGTFGLCMGSGDCRHGNNHCLEGVCNQEDGICKGTQGENSGPDGDGGEGGEDMAALLPYIQKCQAKLPAGDMCQTLDPMMCAHSDPPPASCDECKNKLMGCVKNMKEAEHGAGQGSGEGPEHGGSAT